MKHANKVLGAFVALVALALLLYVGGYFALGKEDRWELGKDIRYFPNKAVAHFYWPAVRVEQSVIGEPDGIGWPWPDWEPDDPLDLPPDGLASEGPDLPPPPDSSDLDASFTWDENGDVHVSLPR